MDSLTATRLDSLMRLTAGAPEVVVALIDGPVARFDPNLVGARIVGPGGELTTARADPADGVCAHGTMVARILAGQGQGATRGICPHCTFLVQPIYTEADAGFALVASIDALAEAIVSSVRAGARLMNLSSAVQAASHRGERVLGAALSFAGRRGVVICAAAGNDREIGSTVITRHPCVIPVMVCDSSGAPPSASNLCVTYGRRAVAIPVGHAVNSDRPGGRFGPVGTSAATPYVTGALALLCALFPEIAAAEAAAAIRPESWARRRALVPPLLDAHAAYRRLAGKYGGRAGGRI